MRRKLPIIFTLGLLLTASSAWAQTVEIDGIWYNISSSGATVESNKTFAGPTVNIPDAVQYNSKSYNVTAITGKAFKDNTNITSVHIGRNVSDIGFRAFEYCTNLATLTFSESATLLTINEQAFQGCGLTSLTLPSRVYKLFGRAFADCDALTSLTVFNGLIYDTSSDAFGDCNNLTTVTILGSGVITTNNPVHKDGGGAYQYMTTLIIGDDITTIGDEAFKGCTELTSLTIGNGVKTIYQKAFYNCTELTNVTIPSNVTDIRTEAFRGSAGPFVLNSNPILGTEAFDAGATVTMNLTANGPVDGYYWTTFYNNYTTRNMQADENTTVYKGTISGSNIVLTEVEDKIVNSGTAVILKSTSDQPVMTFTGLPSQDKHGNDLKGTMADKNTPENCYTLAGKGGKVGFYKYVGAKIKAGKAYLIYTSGSREFLGFDETTGVSQIENGELRMENSFYDLQGRKVTKPTKGLYIVNGKTVVIK